MDEVKKGLDQFLGSEWESLMPNMIETCKSRPAHKGHNGHKGHKEHKCNPVKEMFLFCIHEQILEKCPDSLWKNGKSLKISLLQEFFFSVFRSFFYCQLQRRSVITRVSIWKNAHSRNEVENEDKRDKQDKLKKNKRSCRNECKRWPVWKTLEFNKNVLLFKFLCVINSP